MPSFDGTLTVKVEIEVDVDLYGDFYDNLSMEDIAGLIDEELKSSHNVEMASGYDVTIVSGELKIEFDDEEISHLI